MGQSGTLESFFAARGELFDAFCEAFPVSFDVHDLEFCDLSIQPDVESGDDFLHATFRVVTWDAARTAITNIVEQELLLLWLAPAVGDDIYRVRGFRFCIRPEVVKARLCRFVTGLARKAAARFAASTGTKDVLPENLL